MKEKAAFPLSFHASHAISHTGTLMNNFFSIGLVIKFILAITPDAGSLCHGSSLDGSQ